MLHLDIETYSGVDLRKTTVYRYAESPDFEVMLLAYAVDDDPVTVIDLMRGEKIPDEIVQMLLSDEYLKMAYNANFERVCLSRYFGQHLKPDSWRCSMVHAATMGLPRTLDAVGKVLGLGEDQAKMKAGAALVNYFCKPCAPTKANGQRTRPADAPEQWQTFKEYNAQDVVAEREIERRLSAYEVPEREWEAYHLDQRINDRGIAIDRPFVEQAIHLDDEHRAEITAEAGKISGLANINSLTQLKGWLGISGSLNEEAVTALRASGSLTPAQDRVLAIRQELGKTSVSKYQAMQRCVNSDGRVRGLFAFYGSRTGRWAGRQVQLQNLPKHSCDDLTPAREAVREGDGDGVRALYGSVSRTLSDLIRTAFVAKPGHTFVVVDFSAIEARVIAWLAGEQWRMDAFRQGADIYCASASKMFRVPVVKHGINGHLRQRGKVAELALGYGGSVGALKNAGALKMGLAEEELLPLVQAWREASPHIVALWWQVDEAMHDVMSLPIKSAELPHGLSISRSRKLLHIQLPSGRAIRYWNPKLERDSMGRENLAYDGAKESAAWTRIFSYGPKLVENITQAVARDCLRDAMLRVEAWYPGIVMHVHDEMVLEVPERDAEACLKTALTLMAEPLPWARGLLLKGDGYITPYYRKD